MDLNNSQQQQTQAQPQETVTGLNDASMDPVPVANGDEGAVLATLVQQAVIPQQVLDIDSANQTPQTTSMPQQAMGLPTAHLGNARARQQAVQQAPSRGGFLNRLMGFMGRGRNAPRPHNIADSVTSLNNVDFTSNVLRPNPQRPQPHYQQNVSLHHYRHTGAARRPATKEEARRQLQDLVRQKMLTLPVNKRHLLLEEAAKEARLALAFMRTITDTTTDTTTANEDQQPDSNLGNDTAAAAATATEGPESNEEMHVREQREGAAIEELLDRLAARVAEMVVSEPLQAVNAAAAAAAAPTAAAASASGGAATAADGMSAVNAEAPAAAVDGEPAPASAAAATGTAAGDAATAAPSSRGPAVTVQLVPEFEMYATEAGTAVRLVVSVKAASEVPERARVGLTCVLDRSGSMCGQRILLLQETVHFLVDQLTQHDQLGLVSYSDDVCEDLPLVAMSPAAKAFTHAVVEALTADGSTALYDGTIGGLAQQITGAVPLATNSNGFLGVALPAAATRTAAAAGGDVRDANGNGGDDEDDVRRVCAVLLCTDGEANVGPSNADDILPGLHRAQQALRDSRRGSGGGGNGSGTVVGDEPLTLHTFGIGSGHDASLLQAIAEAQAGVYYSVGGSDDIPEAYGDALGGLLSCVAKSVRVTIAPAAAAASPAFAAAVSAGGSTSSASSEANAIVTKVRSGGRVSKQDPSGSKMQGGPLAAAAGVAKAAVKSALKAKAKAAVSAPRAQKDKDTVKDAIHEKDKEDIDNQVNEDSKDGTIVVSFNDLYAEETREILVEVRMAAAAAASAAGGVTGTNSDAAAPLEEDVLQVTLDYVDATTGASITSMHTLRIKRSATAAAATAAEIAAETANPLVLVTDARYSTASVLRAAAELANQRSDRSAAKKMLDKQAESLRKLAQKLASPQNAAVASSATAMASGSAATGGAADVEEEGKQGEAGGSSGAAANQTDRQQQQEKKHREVVALLLSQVEEAQGVMGNAAAHDMSSIQAALNANTAVLTQQRGTLNSSAPNKMMQQQHMHMPQQWQQVQAPMTSNYAAFDSRAKSKMRTSATTSVSMSVMQKQSAGGSNSAAFP